MADPTQNENVPTYIRPKEFLYETPTPSVSNNSGGKPVRFECPTCSKKFTEFGESVCPDDGSALEVIDTIIGTCFAGRYQILELLGRGGMSTVYKAEHLFMSKTVAVKILHSHLEVQSQTVRRFQQEAKAAGALSHPSIVSVRDFGLTEDGRMFLIMDCVEGKSLAAEIKERGTIPVAELVSWILDILDGLEHAHSKGVVHRDLKPGNIVLSEDKDGVKKPKIVDFGIAKLTSGVDDQHLTSTGEIFGSPLYMSPEQCSGQMLDGRSDVYSMGCVMYEALTGEAPFVGDSALLTMNMQLSSVPESMRTKKHDIPIWLNEIVLKALEKNPKDRIQSAHSFKEALIEGQSQGTSAKLTGYHALVARTARRSKKVLRTLQLHTLTAVATVSILAIIFGVAYQINDSFRKTIDYPIRSLLFSFHFERAAHLLTAGKCAEAVSEFDTAYKNANTRKQKISTLDKMAEAYDGSGEYLKADEVRKTKLKVRKEMFAEGVGLSEEEFTSSKVRLYQMPDPKNSEQAVYQSYLLHHEGSAALKQGDFELANKLFSKAVLYREKWVPEDRIPIVDLRVMIGTANAMNGKVEEAERQWTAADEFMKRYHLPLNSAYVFIPQNLARVQQLKKNNAQAKKLFSQGLDSAKQLKDPKLLKRAYEEYLGFLRATKDRQDLAAIESEYNARYSNR